MKNLTTKLFVCVTCLILAMNCTEKNEDGDDPEILVSPSDPNSLSEVLIMPAGTQRSNGNPPPPTNDVQTPEVDNTNASITSSNGSTAPLNFEYQNVAGNLGGCYAQIDGAQSYFTVPYGSSSGGNGSLQLPIGIPTNVSEGDFCVNFCVYDDAGRVSNIVSTCVSVLRLGTGALQISLSWDNESDQDLYVIDPNGETIYYDNTFSSSGGELDRDDTDGFGPENIFWIDDAPDGQYQVQVNDFDGTSIATSIYVTVSGPSTSRNFTGSTSNGSTANVTTFTKNGSAINF